MIIKFKIPESARRFECPSCGKSFSSGKGLGGHKRVHMENKNKRNHETMEFQVEENGEKTPISCPVCNQSFASEKSLHGHMRKHPDRGWRGMRPPPPPPEAEVPPSNSPPLDHEAISLAYNLLALASGQPRLLQDLEPVRGETSLVNHDRGDFHKTPIKSQKKYPCDICGKHFRSYQALGGHKSHHGYEDDKSAPRCYMEQSEGFGGTSGRGQLPKDNGKEGNGDQPGLGFGLDLNELPPEMDDPKW